MLKIKITNKTINCFDRYYLLMNGKKKTELSVGNGGIQHNLKILKVKSNKIFPFRQKKLVLKEIQLIFNQINTY